MVFQAKKRVAPHAGAWIEMQTQGLRGVVRSGSLPMRERGLKFCGLSPPFGQHRSLPMRERGLKSVQRGGRLAVRPVAPHAGAWIEISRACTGSPGQGGSLPMRERGLKFVIDVHHEQVAEVAPHAGAWIEISRWQTNERRSDGSLPMRECICLMVCVPVYRGFVGRVIGEKLTM